MTRGLLAVGLVLALIGCGTDGVDRGVRTGQVQPGEGVTATGTVGGRQVAISDGTATLITEDCQRAVGLPSGACLRAVDIDGTEIIIGIGNPDAHTPGSSLPVERHDCQVAAQCAEVREAAVVDVIVAGRRMRATGGTSIVRVEQPRRLGGSFNLELGGGRLSGTYDVLPPPDDDAGDPASR